MAFKRLFEAVAVEAELPIIHFGGGILDSKDGLPALAVKASVKLPTGDYKNLRGSGSFDCGLNLIASKAFKRNYLHFNFGVVAPGKWKVLPALQRKSPQHDSAKFAHFLKKEMCRICAPACSLSRESLQHLKTQPHIPLLKCKLERYYLAALFRVALHLIETSSRDNIRKGKNAFVH